MVIVLAAEYALQLFLDFTDKTTEVEFDVVYLIVTEVPVQLPTIVAPPVTDHKYEVHLTQQQWNKPQQFEFYKPIQHLLCFRE